MCAGMTGWLVGLCWWLVLVVTSVCAGFRARQGLCWDGCGRSQRHLGRGRWGLCRGSRFGGAVPELVWG